MFALAAALCIVGRHLWNEPALRESAPSHELVSIEQDSAAANADAHSFAQPFPVRMLALAESESDAEMPFEGSWAHELRLLKEEADKNPEAALERIAEMTVAEERELATKEVCLQLAGSDPALALDAAWRLQLGRVGGVTESATLEILASQWAAADLPAALEWINRQPMDEDGRRDWVVKGIASAWSQYAPADAARFVAESMTPNRIQVDAAMIVVGEWAVADLPAATAWVDLFAEGPLRDRGRMELQRAAASEER
jgi:hypothetical protein